MSLEVYLPTDLVGLTFTVERSPMFKAWTTVQSGREIRNPNQTQPKYKWQLNYEYLTPLTISGIQVPGPNELAAFIFSLRVNWAYFYYRDPDDNLATAMPFGRGDGTTTTFQISKQVLVGSPYSFTENVFAIGGLSSYYSTTSPFSTPSPPVIDSAPVFYVNGTPTTVTGVDRNGIVYFPSAPANNAALTWTGNFYYRCCFSATEANFDEFMWKFWEARQVDFETVIYSQ
jgi:hypothetical protein